MADVEIRLTPGRPKDLRVRHEVLRAVEELQCANIETIRREVSKRLERDVSWPTVNGHLEDLQKQKRVKKHVFARYKTKSTVLVTLPDVRFD